MSSSEPSTHASFLPDSANLMSLRIHSRLWRAVLNPSILCLARFSVSYSSVCKRLILLLTGGDKRKQQADIEAAVGYWNDWKRKNAK